MSNLDDVLRKFALSEGKFVEPSVNSYIQAMEESLYKFEARTNLESRRYEIMKEQIKGIKRHVRRLQERASLLEEENRQLHERVTLLEEEK